MTQQTNPAASLQKELAAKDAHIADLEARLGALASQPVRAALPEHEQPEYEVLDPGIYADDTFYPAGVVIRDVTGRFTPNDCLQPMNEPARDRVRAWLASLPNGRTPPLDAIIEAAMEMRPKEGEDAMSHAEFAASIVRRAKEKILRQSGQPFKEDAPLSMPQSNKHVPMMSNTKVHGGPAQRPRARTLDVKSTPPVSRQPAAPMGNVQARTPA